MQNHIFDEISTTPTGGVQLTGHVLITDITDSDNHIVVLDKKNAIHPENASFSIANALAGTQNSFGINIGSIAEMRFGNGGTIVLSTGRITYKKPRVLNSGGLYSETYRKEINHNLNSNIDSNFNNVSVVHIPGQIYSDIVCLCTLGLGEPSDQNVSSGVSMDGKYIFDELGLYNSTGDSGQAISHIIFHPVEKSANRILQVKYTVRVKIV